MSDGDAADTHDAVAEGAGELAARVDEILAESSTELTIGELVERLHDDEEASVESLGDVHEALHERVLAQLEAEGKLQFDHTSGLVRPASDGDGGVIRPWIGRWGNVFSSSVFVLLLALLVTAAVLSGVLLAI